ncbi:MAG: P1 family peptidase [Roseiflexaceae bacterium]
MDTQNKTLTAVAGVRVGHAQDLEALTGCTVVLLPERCCCGVDVRGGAPGTRETDLLSPTAMVQHINALCLTGGSAFGLASATGVVQWLYERGVGFDTGVARVPIVPAAVIYDLALGSPAHWPDAAMGYAACEAASDGPVAEGCVGAGTGAAVGKLLGIGQATKGGLGSTALRLPDGTTVAALAVTNAFGDVYRDQSATILAGARDPNGGFVRVAHQLTTSDDYLAFGRLNTTLGVVITDALLDKAGCTRLAQMAQDALARTIRPIHTPFDGDIVFAAATGTRPAPHLAALGSAAADALAAAIERSVLTATALGGLPAARDSKLG